MTFQSNLTPLEQRDLADYGFARVRDRAFDAVTSLWKIREAEGLKKKDIATILGRDPAWVTRSLSGPGNWTLRTFGELTAAMRGDVEIYINPVESPHNARANFHAYAEYPEPVCYDDHSVDDSITKSKFSPLKSEAFEPVSPDEDYFVEVDEDGEEDILIREIA